MMVLCQWVAWLAYCFVAMLLYRPVGREAAQLPRTTLLLSVALPARQGMPGLFAGARLAAKRFCQSEAVRSVLLYVTLLTTQGLLGLYAAALLLFRFAIESLSSRYAVSLICDIASRGLLGSCAVLSLDSVTSRGLLGLCVAWLILPLFPPLS